MITVKEIARMCNVSPGTVSNILNGKHNVSDETRNRVLQVVKETGYKPNYFASNMRRQNTKMISIIVEDLDQFTTPPIVVNIMAFCERAGYRTALINMRMYDRWHDTWYNDEDKLSSVLIPALREAETYKVDGVIYVAGHGRQIRCFPENYSLPTVIAYALSEGERFPSIMMDDERGGYDMGKYFISMGHKDVAIITGVSDNMHTQKRLEGFKKALEEEGIQYKAEWTINGNWQKESGYRCAQAAVATGAKAIWCMNDQMAGGLYDYLYENGIIPGRDISVAGFDNMQSAAYMYPKLTTNALPLAEIGSKSAELLIAMIENEGYKAESPVSWIPCNMKIRQSVVERK